MIEVIQDRGIVFRSLEFVSGSSQKSFREEQNIFTSLELFTVMIEVIQDRGKFLDR